MDANLKRFVSLILCLLLAHPAMAQTYLTGDAIRSPDRSKTWTLPAASGALVPQSALDTLSGSLTTHEADTTNIHGISDTANLLTTTNSKTVSGKTYDDGLLLNEETSVTTPASGKRVVYPKADGKLYHKGSDGIETQVGSGSGSSASEIEMLENPEWESTSNDWTASGGTYARTTTSGQYASLAAGAASWDSSSASQTLISDAIPVPAGLHGANGEASCKIKVSSGTATHKLQLYDGTNVLAEQTITNSTTGFPTTTVTSPFPSSGNMQLRIISVASNEPAIYIDSCHLGSARNLGTVSQATLYGSITHPAQTNCGWHNSVAAYTNYSADTDCATPSVTGNASAPSTKIPGVTFSTLPPGDYLVKFRGYMGTLTNSQECYYRMSDGTNAGAAVGFIGPDRDGFIEGRFSYSTAQSNITFQPQSYANPAGNNCSIYNDTTATGQKVEIDVYRFPTSSEQSYRPDLVAVGGTAVYPNGTGKIVNGNNTTWTTLSDADLPTGRTYQGSVAAPSTSNDFGLQSTGALPAGRYMVIAHGAFFAWRNATTDTLCEFSIYDGTTRGPVSDTFATSGATVFYKDTVLATFEYSSQAQRNFVVQYKRGSGDGLCGVDAADARGMSASITIIPLTQNVPAPLLVNSVVSSSQGVERVERVSFGGSTPYGSQCTSNPCTIWESSMGVTSVTRSSAGTYVLNFASGTFSGKPTCTGIAANGSSVAVLMPGAAATQTSFGLSVLNASSAATDGNAYVTCQGPR